jgi:hypothetical protein
VQDEHVRSCPQDVTTVVVVVVAFVVVVVAFVVVVVVAMVDVTVQTRSLVGVGATSCVV